MNATGKTLFRLANAAAVGLYRRTNGRVGGHAKGRLPVLLLTVPGRRSGVPRTVPITFFEHDGGYLVVASAGGAKAEPQWIRNLGATNRAEVQVLEQRADVDVRIPDRVERDWLWGDVVLARAPFFAGYEQKSGRTIRVALLRPHR